MSFFMMRPFCTHHSNCVLHWLLTWHFYMKMMHFQYLYFQLKKRYYSFFEKVFIFQIICLKVKVLKTFETFIDCHIKTWPHLSPRAILKIPSTILTVFARRNTCQKKYHYPARRNNICKWIEGRIILFKNK